MNEVEFPHEEGDEEVQFRDDDPKTETTPPTPITSHDMEVIIKGWEVKFEQILRCLREVQLASEKANSDMFGMSREGRAREDQQERRIEAMHVGFTEFIEKCDPAHLISSRHLDAPTASTTWMSAIQPRESWYLSGWIRDSPIDFLVDPGAVVSAISLQCYEKLVEHAYEGHANGIRSGQQVRHESTWNVQLGTISTWITN